MRRPSLLLPPLLLLLLALLAPLSAATPSADATTNSSNSSSSSSTLNITRPIVAGYLPDYRLADFPYEEVFRQGLTHLIFFSLEINATTGGLLYVKDRLPPKAAWRHIRSLADHYDVRLIVSIGGGGRSAGFGPVLADPVRRIALRRALNALLLEREFDGVDLDWEYPQSADEWSLYARFIRELRSSLGYAALPLSAAQVAPLSWRERWDVWLAEHRRTLAQRQLNPYAMNLSSTANRRLWRVQVRPASLSLALHPHPSIAAVVQQQRLLPVVDHVHWMAYDYLYSPEEAAALPRGEEPTHSSPSYTYTVTQDTFIGGFDDTFFVSGKYEEKEKAAEGTPLDGASPRRVSAAPPKATTASTDAASVSDHRRKLLLGVPFYGRHMTNPRYPAETYAGIMRQVLPWTEKHKPNPPKAYKRFVRSVTSFSDYGYVSFDGVQEKLEVAALRGMGGVVIWELGQDMLPPSQHLDYALLGAVREYLEARGWRAPAAYVAKGVADGDAAGAAAATETWADMELPPAPVVKPQRQQKQNRAAAEGGDDDNGVDHDL